MSEVVSYKCPSCGAGLSFDIEKQNWACAFCLNEFSLDALKRAAEQEPVPPSGEETFDGGAAYTCPSCGGSVVTDRNTTATFCVFCHNPAVIASRLEKERRPSRVLPFKLQKEDVLAAMAKLLRRRPLLPGDFREILQKGEIGGVYLPFWLVSAEVRASLNAHGYIITSWSDSRYRYTKTDTYQVEREADIGFRQIPADGSDRMDDRLMQALEPFDYSQLMDFDMGYLSGHFAESYDVDSEEASIQAFARMDDATRRMMSGLVEGYHSHTVTNLHTSRSGVDCRYVMLPVWLLTATYRDKIYTFAMNGQTGKMVGKLPISGIRAGAWFAGIAGAAAVLAFAGGMLL